MVVPDTVRLPAIVTTPSATVIRSVSSVCPIVVPLIATLSTVSAVRVPTEVKLDAVTVELSVLPVTVPAAAVMVILPVPSKLVPLIVREVASAVAVAAFPVES